MSSVPTLTMPDGRTFRLGRIPPKAAFDYGPFRVVVTPDDRKKVMPRLGAFFDHEHDSAPPPAQVDYWTKGMQAVKEMYLNDRLGDCCLAMIEHSTGLWTGNELGTPIIATDQETSGNYHHVCGPGDNGCVVTDVMDAWKRGLPMGGVTHRIDDYVAIDWTNKQLVQVAIDIFGTIQLGVSLPSAWTKTNCVWGPSRGNVGGHCVPAGSYGANLSDANGKPFNADGVSISTWAGLALITWPCFLSHQYIGEAYVPLSPDWYSNGNLAPNGINVAGLQAAFQAIKNGQVPDVPTPPPAVIDWHTL
jgi:hypothetical protein